MRIIFTLFLTFFASLSYAEPSSAIQTLMDRKLTMFDWGMFKAERRLNQDGMETYVSYNWDDNEIIISLSDWGSHEFSMEETKSECKKVFSKIDDKLFIDEGADRYEAFCLFCDYFTHNGWTNDIVDEARKEIKDRLYYRYSIFGFTCERKAYGTSISVTSY